MVGGEIERDREVEGDDGRWSAATAPTSWLLVSSGLQLRFGGGVRGKRTEGTK